MNRGNIPGYYYDEEKQKYFKIQANHLVPLGAKYAKSSVRQEKRSTKKRKIEQDKLARREKQTTKPAPVLKSAAIGGIGLLQEHGFDTRDALHLLRRERAVVSQWEPEWVPIKLPSSSSGTRLQNACYIPETETMVISATNVHSGFTPLVAAMWPWEEISTDGTFPMFQFEDRLFASRSFDHTAFNSPISTISSVYNSGTTEILACAEQHQNGNVAVSTICEDPNQEPPLIRLTLGPPGSIIADSSIHPITRMAAIIGNFGICILDSGGHFKDGQAHSPSKEDWPRCEPCINWLDTNIVMYGAKPGHGHSIMLWDVRTREGTTARFNVRERLTGVFNPTKYGTQGLGDEYQILASTNHRIDLFDTRMPNTRMHDTPVLSFSHVHGGPRLQRATHGSLVAAVDAENTVQVYSIRTGTKIRSLKAPDWKPRKLESPVLGHLQWYDDIKGGPMLQAVRGNGIVRWVWGGGVEEVEDG